MRTLNFYLNLNIVLVLQTILCAEFFSVPVTQESVKCPKENQNTLMEAETLILKEHHVEKTLENDLSHHCNSNEGENSDTESDDSKLIEDYSFKRSTIDYLKKILEELKNESSNVAEFFNRSRLLKYIDKSIYLINLFNNIFLYYKYDCNIIRGEKMGRVIFNFDFFDRSFLEINEVLNESVGRSGENNMKILSEGLNSFETRVNEIKAEFKQYKVFQDETAKYDFILKIDVLNEHKKSLDDVKELITPMSIEEIEEKAGNFKNGLLKVIPGVYESLCDCLKSEYELLIYDFEILNNILIDTGKCLNDLKSYLEIFMAD